MSIRVGDRGTTVGELRPSGFIDLNGRRVAATTDTGFVPDGQPVVVVGSTPFGVKVRPPAEVADLPAGEPLDTPREPAADPEPAGGDGWRRVMLAVPVGVAVSAGGWGYQLAGWDGVMIGLGVVGIAIAVLFGLVVWVAGGGGG